MAMMDDLDVQIDLAENFLRAGNITRAESLCREVLEKRHDDLGAFLCLFDVHMAQDKTQDALELCDWRLARRPECADGHLNRLIAFGVLSNQEPDYDYVRQITGENFMSKIRLRLSNHPLKLAQAEILYSLYFLDPQDTLRLVNQERLQARLSSEWLDTIETVLNVETGNTVQARQLLVKRLSENPQDTDALHNLAVTDYFSGRLFSAIKYARQAQRTAPEQSALSQEVIIASIIGLLPIFWLGQIIITLTIFASRRLEDYLAMPLRFGGLIVMILAYGKLVTKFIELDSGGANIVLTVIILIGIWAGYILFSFGEIGSKVSGRKKSIKLSKKY